MNKWLTISLGAVLGISHIGMIGLLSNRESKLPSLDIPVGPYTSYLAEVNKEGYRISYKANDPKTMYITKDIKKKGGFLGLANNTEKITDDLLVPVLVLLLLLLFLVFPLLVGLLLVG